MPIEIPHPSRRPFLRFSPRRETWLVGDKAGTRTIALTGMAVALDPENVRRGWLSGFVDGANKWAFTPTALSGPMPEPTTNEAKVGFSLFAYAPKAFGSLVAYEMTNATRSHLDYVERLYNETEAGFGRGEVPLVVFGPSRDMRFGEHETRFIDFTVPRWVQRSAAFPIPKRPESTEANPALRSTERE